MKGKHKSYFLIITVILILINVFFILRSGRWGGHKKDFDRIDTVTAGKSKLIIISSDAKLSKETVKKLAQTFVQVYPALTLRFNPSSSRKIILLLDTVYKGIAGTKGDIVRINSKWLIRHPQETDVLTHELMHVVQNFPIDVKLTWIKEGMADYVRYKIGLNNINAKWKLPPLTQEHNYVNSYRVAAKFFVWLEQRYGGLLIDHLNSTLFQQGYSAAFWSLETGRTLDQLWSDYMFREFRKNQ